MLRLRSPSSGLFLPTPPSGGVHLACFPALAGAGSSSGTYHDGIHDLRWAVYHHWAVPFP